MIAKIKEFLDGFTVEMNFSEVALLKTSMVSFGALIGMLVAERNKKFMGFISGAVFLGTAGCLIYKLLGCDLEECFIDDHACSCDHHDSDDQIVDINEFCVD